jgi:hypothetical protein
MRYANKTDTIVPRIRASSGLRYSLLLRSISSLLPELFHDPYKILREYLLIRFELQGKFVMLRSQSQVSFFLKHYS